MNHLRCFIPILYLLPISELFLSYFCFTYSLAIGIHCIEYPFESALCAGIIVLYLFTILAVMLYLVGVDNRKVVTGGFVLAYVLAVLLAYT